MIVKQEAAIASEENFVTGYEIFNIAHQHVIVSGDKGIVSYKVVVDKNEKEIATLLNWLVNYLVLVAANEKRFFVEQNNSALQASHYFNNDFHLS